MDNTVQSLLRWQLYFVKNYEITTYLHTHYCERSHNTEEMRNFRYVAPMKLRKIVWPDDNDYDDLYTCDEALNILRYLEQYNMW